MRILLFTGKGGVGKTTVAAATAVAVRRGRPPHAHHEHRPRAFARGLVRPRPQRPRAGDRAELWAEQIDAQERLEANWRDIQEYVIAFLNWAGVDAIEAEELSVIPGLDEIFSLTDVKSHVDRGATTRS